MVSQSSSPSFELFIALQLLRHKPKGIALKEHLQQLRAHVKKPSNEAPERDSSDEARFDGIARLKSLLAKSRSENHDLQSRVRDLEAEKTALQTAQEHADMELSDLKRQIELLERKNLVLVTLQDIEQEETPWESLPLPSELRGPPFVEEVFETQKTVPITCEALPPETYKTQETMPLSLDCPPTKTQETHKILHVMPTANSQRKRKAQIQSSKTTDEQRYALRSTKRTKRTPVVTTNPRLKRKAPETDTDSAKRARRRIVTLKVRIPDLSQISKSQPHDKHAQQRYLMKAVSSKAELPVELSKNSRPNPFRRFYGAWLKMEKEAGRAVVVP